MITEIEKSKALLQSVQRVAQHQEEIKRLRGESFNVFSILKMESRENATHSAFLGELLNPQGSHFFKSLFLELFLKSINYQGELESKSAKLILENHIGSRNDQLKTGGRIDIYISDLHGNSISVENKIHAGDQGVQIERYVSHNTKKNKVYYLTLSGEAASKNSKGNLIEGQDYFCISYKKTIIDWLEKCLKEATEQPILRESIKQYIILIKKLTNQLTDANMDNEIRELIINNYVSAKLIQDKVWEIELNEGFSFLGEVKKELEQQLKEGWTVTVDEDLNQSMTGMRIVFKDWDNIFIKIEGGNKVPWAISWYGLVAPKNIYDRTNIMNKLAGTSFIKEGYKESEVWPCYKALMSLASTEERSRLFNPEKRADLLHEVSEKLIDFAKECQELLSGIKKK